MGYKPRCVYIYIHVYVYVYIYICVYVYIYKNMLHIQHIDIHIRKCTCADTYTHACNRNALNSSLLITSAALAQH